MKQITEQEAYTRLTALCAAAEHCTHEMTEKMHRWELPEEAQARIMQRLVEGRYIDDERFARAFANDKLLYNKWGRRKIEQAMWLKRIDRSIQQRVLDDIADTDYLNILRPMLESKRKSIKAGSDYELNMKLIRFAMGRGFTIDLIRQCLDGADDIDED
jgi:regulatory protein